MNSTDERCTARTKGERATFYRPGRCMRRASVVRDGKGYCKQHDPEEIKAREWKHMADYQAQFDAAQAARAEGEAFCREIGFGVPYWQPERPGQKSGFQRSVVLPIDELRNLLVGLSDTNVICKCPECGCVSVRGRS